jgi:hypothetical protein
MGSVAEAGSNRVEWRRGEVASCDIHFHPLPMPAPGHMAPSGRDCLSDGDALLEGGDWGIRRAVQQDEERERWDSRRSAHERYDLPYNPFL